MKRLISFAFMLATLTLAGSARAADEVNLTPDEAKILELVNKARADIKLPPVKTNKKLMEAARQHSANMAKQEKMEHVLDGKTPADRIKAKGYVYAKCGENIASGEGWKIDDVHEAWMKSDGHKKNILDPDYTEIGIGVELTQNAKGEAYYTQVFAKPK